MRNRGTILFLAVAFIIAGLFITFLGAKDIYVINVQSRNWVETQASYTDKEIYESTPQKTTYWLHYTYVVDGKEYAVTTDYITSKVPAAGSTQTIKYNPQNPEEVVFSDRDANIPLFIAGLVLLAFPILFLSFVWGKLKVATLMGGVIAVGFGTLFFLVKFPLVCAIIFWVVGVVLLVLEIRTRNIQPAYTQRYGTGAGPVDLEQNDRKDGR